MISPYDHTADTNRLSKDCNLEIMELANVSMNILKNTMNAEGFNFGANLGKASGAGIEEHLHYHIVPRWNGDTNFMPLIGHTKVMVEGLNETWNILKPYFDKLKESTDA
jgi:ATP adenylyltransferase